MSDEERAPLLMAHRCGLKIEFLELNKWYEDIEFDPEEFPYTQYRIAPV